MSEDLVSVIIPAYNAAATIEHCLAAVINQDYDQQYEIIVIDDGSTDRTAELARAAGASVHTIPNSHPAAARNTGIHLASGDIVCCTDADCAPHPDWLKQITAPLADATIAACKGTYSNQQKELVARFVQLEYEDKYDLLRPQTTIDFIDTYSAAYRREILLANNGFDERFIYLEDQELSFRLAARGYRMVFQETAVVEHRHSATLLAYAKKKATIGYWKAQVVRRFPGQVVRDSHTPQVMKFQILLMALVLAAALISIIAIPARSWLPTLPGYLFWAPITLTGLLFLATTIPFASKAWSKDRAVALASPFLLAVRALALGAGYLWGVVRPRAEIQEAQTISGLNYVAKRILDICGAIVGLIFTMITWPLFAMLIKLDSKGPVFYRQIRVGERGNPFTLYKYRSMQVDADEKWPDLVASLGLAEPVLKLSDDPRLTRIGRFMRRWSLDELPQFWNVLRGDMSLVGPRPEEPRVADYYNDWHRRRLSVKPGISGLMQINGRADLTLDERTQLDLNYIENYSLWGDLKILWRTIPVVLRGDGAR